jgi:hypothetical protein
MITLQDVAAANRSDLYDIKGQLQVDKMKLDRFFSIFLDQNEMDEDDLDTPVWFTYKEMLKEYDRIDRLLKTTDFYIKQNA